MNHYNFVSYKDFTSHILAEDSFDDKKIWFNVDSSIGSAFRKSFLNQPSVSLKINGQIYPINKKSYNSFINDFPIQPVLNDVKNFQDKMEFIIQKVDKNLTYENLKQLYLTKTILDNKIQKLENKYELYVQHAPSRDSIKDILDYQNAINNIRSSLETNWKEKLSWVTPENFDMPLHDLFCQSVPPAMPEAVDDNVWVINRNLKRGMNKDLFDQLSGAYGPSWTTHKKYDKSLIELTSTVTNGEIDRFIRAWTKDPASYLKCYVFNADDRTPIIALKHFLNDPKFLNDAITICNAWALGKDFRGKIKSFNVTRLEDDKQVLIKNIVNYYMSYINLLSNSSTEGVKGFIISKVEKTIETMLKEDKNILVFHVDFDMKYSDMPQLYRQFENRLRYQLFTPVFKDSQWSLTLPCSSGVLAYFKAAYPGNSIKSNLGNSLKIFFEDCVKPSFVMADSTMTEICDDTSKNQHQTGVNVPGIPPMTNADSFDCGLLGFYIHDLYHCELGNFVPAIHRQLFSRIVEITKDYFKDNANQNLRRALFRFIDMEHVKYRVNLIRHYIKHKSEPDEDMLDQIHAKSFSGSINSITDEMSQQEAEDVWKIIIADSSNWSLLNFTDNQLQAIKYWINTVNPS